MNEDWQGLSLVELLDLLEPVPEPAPISMWPQTIGWLWLSLIVLFALGYIGYRLARYRRRTAYRRAALAELATYPDDNALALLIRRTALAAYPRARVASLSGRAWLSFLDRTGSGSSFTDGPGKSLATAPYRDTAAETGARQAVSRWIRHHHADPDQPS